MLSDMFKLKDTIYSDTQAIHTLKVDLKTGKLTVKHVSAYNVGTTCVMPKLNTNVQLKTRKIGEDEFKYIMLCDDKSLNIFVNNQYSNKKLISDVDKPVRIELYKSIISECLKECIYKLTVVFNKTNSKDVGEEINHLTKIYSAYTKDTP